MKNSSNRFYYVNFLILLGFLFNLNLLSAQDNSEQSENTEMPKTDFYDYRGINVIDVSIGASVINGDYPDPLFDVYWHFGYKHYIIPFVNVGVSYHKFNLAYKDLFNNGYMSFDMNIEVLPFPHERFSPFIYFGGGIHAANYFEDVASKIQGGLGIEYIVYEGVGLTLYTDYNNVFSDEVDGRIFGDSDDAYWRMAVGINFYFGGQKKKDKLLKNVPTVIKTNPITSQ